MSGKTEQENERLTESIDLVHENWLNLKAMADIKSIEPEIHKVAIILLSNYKIFHIKI